MAINPIRAVVFDMGGTLEDLTYDETIRQEATPRLREFLHGLEFDPGLSLPDLRTAVFSGLAAHYHAGSLRPEAPAALEALYKRAFLTDKADSGTLTVPPNAAIYDLREVVDLVTPHPETVHVH